MKTYIQQLLFTLALFVMLFTVTSCSGTVTAPAEVSGERVVSETIITPETVDVDGVALPETGELVPYEEYLATELEELGVAKAQLPTAIQQITDVPAQSIADSDVNILELASASNVAPLLAENLGVPVEEFQAANMRAYSDFAAAAIAEGVITTEQANYEEALLNVDFNQLINEAREATQQEELNEESVYYQLIAERFEQMYTNDQITEHTYHLLQLTVSCGTDVLPEPEITTIDPNFLLYCISSSPFNLPDGDTPCLDCDEQPWSGSGGGSVIWAGSSVGGFSSIPYLGTSDINPNGLIDGYYAIIEEGKVPPCYQKDSPWIVIKNTGSTDISAVEIVRYAPYSPLLVETPIAIGKVFKYCGRFLSFEVVAPSSATWECQVPQFGTCPEDATP